MVETKARIGKRLARHRWNKPVVWDVLFVLVLPVACLILDPGFLRAGMDLIPLYWIQLPAYFLIGLVILVFWVSLIPGLPALQHWLLNGGVLLGVLLSGFFAAILTPLALLAFPMNIGALLVSAPPGPAAESMPIWWRLAFAMLPIFGFVPAFTFARLFRRYNALRKRTAEGVVPHVATVAGFVSPLVLAVLLYVGASNAVRPSLEAIESNDPDIAIAAAEKMSKHPLCRSACQFQIVKLQCNHKLVIAADQIGKLFKGSYGLYVLFENGECMVL